MQPEGFEPAIRENERPQTQVLDHAAPGVDIIWTGPYYSLIFGGFEVNNEEIFHCYRYSGRKFEWCTARIRSRIALNVYLSLVYGVTDWLGHDFLFIIGNMQLEMAGW